MSRVYFKCLRMSIPGLVLQIAAIGILADFIPLDIPGAAAWLAFVAGSVLNAWGLTNMTHRQSVTDFVVLLSLNLFLPVYGAVGSIFLAIANRKLENRNVIAEYHAHVKAEIALEKVKGDYSASRHIRRELEIQSYQDIILGSDRLLKKALIRKIRDQWVPGGIGLLKLALRDDEYEIISYAATALTYIEERIYKGILDLKNEIERNPGDLKLKIRLAQKYIDYAGSGLVDTGTCAYYTEMATGLLDDALRLSLADQDLFSVLDSAQPLSRDEAGIFFPVLLMQRRIAQVLGNSESELELCNEILSMDPSHHDTLSRLCSLQFDLRMFGEIGYTARQFIDVVKLKKAEMAKNELLGANGAHPQARRNWWSVDDSRAHEAALIWAGFSGRANSGEEQT